MTLTKTYHLTPIIYTIYSITTMFILSLGIFFVLFSLPISISAWMNILVFIISLLISAVWFWFYRITIDGTTITIPQKYGFKRTSVTPEDITKIMFRYYYPTKHGTTRGIRGYKLNLHHNPKTFIKMIAHEFSFQARYEIFSFLLEHNETIEQNQLFEQEMLFLTHKVEMKRSTR